MTVPIGASGIDERGSCDGHDGAGAIAANNCGGRAGTDQSTAFVSGSGLGMSYVRAATKPVSALGGFFAMSMDCFVLAFYDFPGRALLGASENYQSVESTLATVRNRSKITRGPGSRAAGIAMAYKLIEASQSRLCAVNAPIWSRSFALRQGSKTATRRTPR